MIPTFFEILFTTRGVIWGAGGPSPLPQEKRRKEKKEKKERKKEKKRKKREKKRKKKEGNYE